MHNISMQAINALLQELKPITPVPTGLSPHIKRDTTIRALVFDIYGTLLVSESGDIHESIMSKNILKRALTAGNVNITVPDGFTEQEILRDLMNLHFDSIKTFHEEHKANGVPHPEVDIIEICRRVLQEGEKRQWLSCPKTTRYATIMFIFELLSNRIGPMPHLKETIYKLNQKNIPLGIVSNAQFYTPILLNYYLNNELKETETVPPFDTDICVFSYQLLRAKPDVRIFEHIVPALKEKYQLSPQQVLYVGNDMLNDVYTAQQAGFKTALFAGDKLSLRWRKDRPLVAKCKPDYMITDLRQLSEII